MQQYLDLLKYIKNNWINKEDRTGVGTKSIFGYQMRFNLSDWFPLLTTKKIYLKAIIYELLWFLKGDTNIKYLVDNDIKIRNERAYSSYLKNTNQELEYPRYSHIRNEKFIWFVLQIKNNIDFAKQRWDLWPVYGKQWRARTGNNNFVFDQIADVV